MRYLTLPRSLAAVLVLAAVAGACGSNGGSAFDSSSSGGTTGGPPGGGGTTSSGGFGTSGGNPDGGGDTPTVSALVFDPPSQTLTLDGVTPKSTTFKLRATQLDGSVVDVAPESLEFDRPDLASAANGVPVTLTAAGAFGGKGHLHAVYGGREAQAELIVNVVVREVGSGIAGDIVTALDGATTTDPGVTALRYPYDKTVFPLGLASPLIMWDAPAANDVYRLHLEQASYTYDLFAAVAQPGQLRVAQAVWDRITASNGGDALQVKLSRYSTSTQQAYASASVSWTIAPASLRGAIYYWYASKNGTDQQGHIARIRPGVGATPETMSSGQADPCMGCHAVSADGSTLAASVSAAPSGDPDTYSYTNGWSTGRGWASFDLPSGTVRKQTTMNGSNLALTPDGKYAVFGGRMQSKTQKQAGQWQAGSKYMSLADTATGTIVVASGLDDVVLADSTVGLSMPAFSPDGKLLAAVEFNGDLQDNVLPNSTAILLFGFNQQTLKFEPTPKRLPLGTYAFPATGIGYPSFTPDTKYVAFHVGNHSTGCFDACDDTTQHQGEIHFQSTDGVTPSVRLTNLDDPPAASDRGLSVEPTFNPIQRGNYSWVVFTSMRDWGNKLTGPAMNAKRRLWVAAIDGTPGSADPSHPAFYLEGQEDLPNMRGFWTLASCTATPPAGAAAGAGACQAGFECCSGFCDRGICVDVSKLACVGLGGDCSDSAKCCNAQSVSCTSGKCVPNIVK